jgi:aminoglycoside phosphotransferase (APT) family kinase protein
MIAMGRLSWPADAQRGLPVAANCGDSAGDEEALVGDGVTPGIVRIGDTVRRPVRPFTASVQAYLAHLHSAGFSGAPVPLGVDEQGREVLSFVPGDVPREPLPPEATGEDVLAALARLIRQLHDASLGWTPPDDAVWGGNQRAGDVPELVSHRDYCPGNVVFRAGLPAALIDFDLACPTTRLYDIANAVYWWAPLLHPLDRAPALADADIPRRVAIFADAYGMNPQLRQELVPFADQMIHLFHRSFRAAAETDPVFRRMWDEGVKDRLPRAEAWIGQAGPGIAARLVTTSPGNPGKAQRDE